MKIVSLIILALCFSANALAQQQNGNPSTDKPNRTSIQLQIIQAELEAKVLAVTGEKPKEDSINKLADLYRQAMADPDAAKWLVSKLYNDFNIEKASARSAMQVSQVADETSVRFQLILSLQNQTIIEQNKRMIELLERLANRK